MSGQIDVVDLKIEVQELREQLKLLENIVTEQQQETRSYIKKILESSHRVSQSSLNTRKLSRDTLIIKKFSSPDTLPWISSGITTHTNGYVLKIRVDVIKVNKSTNTAIRILSYLDKGPYDEFLQWPFEGIVLVKIINQLQMSKPYHTYLFEYDGSGVESERVDTIDEKKLKSKRSVSSYAVISDEMKRHCLINDCLQLHVTAISLSS